MRFRFIEDHRADYPVRIMCGAIEVSPAGFYAWRSRPVSQRSTANRDLLDHIARIHRDTRVGTLRLEKPVGRVEHSDAPLDDFDGQPRST